MNFNTNTSDERILLTGGTGFLGSALARQLASQCKHLTILKRTTSRLDRVTTLLSHPNISWIDIDKTNLVEIFKTNHFDIIIHCATNYGRGNTNILDIVAANLMLPLTLLQLGIQHGVKTFINTDTIIDKRISYYSLSKKQFLDWFQTTADDIKCINLALEHFYGPFDDESKFTTMVFRSLLRNEPYIPLTPGEQKRHFIHIDDVVQAFLCVIKHREDFSSSYTSFEVSTEESISIRNFVELAKTISGNKTTELRFGAKPYRPNELMDSQTDISALRQLGWEPSISLEAGIKMTMEKELAK